MNRASWRAWRWLVPGVALLGFLFRDLARGLVPVGADVGLYSLPRFQLLARLWRSASAPGWNPYLGLGGPLIGDATLGFFYPGNLLVLLASPQAALCAYLVLHLALGLAGVFALGRRLELSPPAACLAACSFALGGVALGQLHTPIYVAATGWLPWALLAFLQHLTRPSAWTGAVAALPFALMFLLGAPENTVLAGALALACAPLAGSRLRRAAPHLLGVAAFAMALAGVGLVPTWFVYQGSARGAGFPLEEAARWSLHPLELVGLLLPHAFAADALTAAAAGETSRVWHASLYVGVIGLACAALGLPALARRREARPLLVLAALLLVLSFGTRVRPSLFALGHRLLPGLSSFRFPAKLFVPVSLVLALAAGVGCDQLRLPRGRRRLCLALGGLGLAALALALLGWAWQRPGLCRSAAIPALTATAALAALTWAPAPRRRQALLVLLAVELALAGDRLTAFGPARLVAQRPRLVEAVWRLDEALGPQRVYTAPGAFAARVDVPGLNLNPGTREQLSWREAMFPNTGMPYGLRSSDAFTSLRAARRMSFRRAATRADLPLARAARLLGARLLVSLDGDPAFAAAAGPALAASGPFRLRRLPAAPPWAAVYARVRPAAADDALKTVLRTDFDPAQACVWEGEGGPSGAAAPAPATLLRDSWDELELQVDSPAGGVLVVREAYDAGWVAQVDGAQVAVRPADHLFRGVRVPPGRHRVRLRYRTPGRWVGILASLLAAAYSVLVLWRRAHSYKTEP